MDLRELAILATARGKDARHVWSVHTILARRAVLGEAAITVVRERTSLQVLQPAERDVVDDAASRSGPTASPRSSSTASGTTTASPLVELTCVMGHFGVISSVVNAFELAPEAGADPLPLE